MRKAPSKQPFADFRDHMSQVKPRLATQSKIRRRLEQGRVRTVEVDDAQNVAPGCRMRDAGFRDNDRAARLLQEPSRRRSSPRQRRKMQFARSSHDQVSHYPPFVSFLAI